MWRGCAKTFATTPALADVVDAIGAWLATNPGSLTVTHTPGVSVVWKNGASYPDCAHFGIDSNAWNGITGWVSCRAFCETGAETLQASTGASSNMPLQLRFAIDDWSGKAWLMLTPDNPDLDARVVVFDVLPRPVDALPEFSSPLVLHNGDEGQGVYYINTAGDYVADTYLTAGTPFFRSKYLGEMPPGSPAKAVLPVSVSSASHYTTHLPSTVVATAVGPGWAEDETLQTWPAHTVRYYSRVMAALISPLDANWHDLS